MPYWKNRAREMTKSHQIVSIRSTLAKCIFFSLNLIFLRMGSFSTRSRTKSTYLTGSLFETLFFSGLILHNIFHDFFVYLGHTHPFISLSGYNYSINHCTHLGHFPSDHDMGQYHGFSWLPLVKNHIVLILKESLDPEPSRTINTAVWHLSNMEGM